MHEESPNKNVEINSAPADRVDRHKGFCRDEIGFDNYSGQRAKSIKPIDIEKNDEISTFCAPILSPRRDVDRQYALLSLPNEFPRSNEHRPQNEAGLGRCETCASEKSISVNDIFDCVRAHGVITNNESPPDYNLIKPL